MEKLTHNYYIPSNETVNNKPIVFTEVLDQVKKTMMGQMLANQPPRWSTDQRLSDDEHIVNYITNPDLIPEQYSGFKQDLIETPLSDADSFDHMQLCLKVSQIIMLEEQNKTYKEFDREYLIAMNLANGLHDIQEAYVGDSITKDLAFKIEEHRLFDGEVREQLRPILPIKDFDKVLTEAFRVLFAEKKLDTKYGVTRADLEPLFEVADINSRNNTKYRDMNELYESAHNVTFFLGVLSNKGNHISDFALKYDVMQNALPKLFNDGHHIEFIRHFLNHNENKIRECVNYGKLSVVEKWLKDNGRKFTAPKNILNPEI